VYILKGIRNIRHLEDNVIDKVTRCASDNGVKARVRVAALDAFLADPCSPKVSKINFTKFTSQNSVQTKKNSNYLDIEYHLLYLTIFEYNNVPYYKRNIVDMN
jgi:hypothetical protein